LYRYKQLKTIKRWKTEKNLCLYLGTSQLPTINLLKQNWLKCISLGVNLLARKCPILAVGGRVEVRSIQPM